MAVRLIKVCPLCMPVQTGAAMVPTVCLYMLQQHANNAEVAVRQQPLPELTSVSAPAVWYTATPPTRVKDTV